MFFQIIDLIGVARQTQLPNFLSGRDTRERHDQRQNHALRLTILRSIEAIVGRPASAIESFNSAPSIHNTRSTPGWPNAARPHNGARPTSTPFAPRAIALTIS